MTNLRFDALGSVPVDQRAHICRGIYRIADLERRCPCRYRFEQLRVNPALDQHPLNGAADLSVARGEASGYQRGRRRIDIDVAANNRCIVTAKLEMNFFQRLSRDFFRMRFPAAVEPVMAII